MFFSFVKCRLEGHRAGQVVLRDHFLHAADHEVGYATLDKAQQFADAGCNDGLDISITDDFLQVGGKIFGNDYRLRTAVGELVFHFPRRIEGVGIDNYQAGLQDTV